MTNRFLPVLTRTTRVCETSFNLCSEDYVELSRDFEGALLALEQRHSDEVLLPQAQAAASSFDDDSFEDNVFAPCCFDASGLQIDSEIDVRWI